jgi:hypothetical protein
MTPFGRGYSRLYRDFHTRSPTRPRQEWRLGCRCLQWREVISAERRPEMNALIDYTQGEETDRRPGDGARELNVLVVALDAVIPTNLLGTKVLVVAPGAELLAPAMGVGRRRRTLPSGRACGRGRRPPGTERSSPRGSCGRRRSSGCDRGCAVDVPGQRNPDRRPAGSLESDRGRARVVRTGRFALPTFHVGESLSKAA